MIGNRNRGNLAVLGGLTAAVALSTGLATAYADELADLKANQELLKARIDQLALGAPGGVPPAGAPSLAGSFPRSFLIPGTDTSLLIGGYVKFDAADWLSGGTPNGNASVSLNGGASSVPSTPLDLHGTGLFAPPFFNPHSRGSGVVQFTAKESRLRVETRTPTAWGEADTVWEMDFYGCQSGGGAGDCSALDHTSNANLPRLRLAYGTLGGFIAGQNWVPVFDLDAHAELLDFGGEAGSFGYARAPQVGYKWAGPWGMSFTGALVYPTTSIATAAGGIATDTQGGTAGSVVPTGGAGQLTALGVNPAKSVAPDLNLVARWRQPWGHFQVSGIVQELELEDGALISKDYVGYGGGFGLNVKPAWFGWVKDNLGAEFWAGNGLDRYADSGGTGTEPFTFNGLATNFGGPGAGCYGFSPATAGVLGGTLTGKTGAPLCTAAGNTAANAAKVLASTVVAFGGQVNYQHWWTPSLRTTVSGGVQHQDIPTGLVGLSNMTFNYNKEVLTAHANLIWSPVAFINTGIEYTYAHRDTIWNVKGDQNVLDFAFQVKF